MCLYQSEGSEYDTLRGLALEEKPSNNGLSIPFTSQTAATSVSSS